MYNVPYTALTMHLSYNPADIASAIQFAAIITTLATLLTAVLTFATAEFVEFFTESCLGSDDSFCAFSPLQLAHIALGLMSGVICTVCAIIVAINLEEQPQSKAVAIQKTDSVWFGMKKVFTHRSYLILIFMFIWVWMGQAVIQTNFIIYAQMKGGLNLTFTEAAMVLLSMLGSCTLSVPLWFICVQKFGKKRTFTMGMALLILPTMSLYFLPPDAPLFVKHLTIIIYGIPLSCVYLVPSMMLPDVINESAVQNNGYRREALYFSYFVMFQKFGAGAAIYLSSEVLQQYGYDSSIPASEQSTEVSDALRVLIGFVVPGFMVIGLIASPWYPISTEDEKLIQDELQTIRELIATREAGDETQQTNGVSTPVPPDTTRLIEG